MQTSTRTPRQELFLSVWAMVAAFGTYFCMYAFRKPFEVGEYRGHAFALGESRWELFTLVVTAQTIGYTLSKFLGIKVISEVSASARVYWLVGLIGLAELALLGFALVPPPWNFVSLFFNGLALGMVFGMVMGFLEGRRTTEALLAALCASFIIASGVVKSVGKSLIQDYRVNEYWMPFVTGLLFVPPLLLCTWMLTRIPPPTAEDIALRSARTPMTSADRWAFFNRYALGLILLVGFYVLLTILRTVRDVYGNDIWKGLGFGKAPGIFAQSETLVMFGVVAINGLAVIFRNNRLAFLVALGTSCLGLLLGLVSLVSFGRGWVDGFTYMVLLGMGLYLPYVAFHTTLLDRLVALLRDRGNIGFLMYLADSFGYLGFVVFINIAGPMGLLESERFMDFFQATNYALIAISLVVLVVLTAYFILRTAPQPEANLEPASSA